LVVQLLNLSLNNNCKAGETNGPHLVKMKANRVAGGDKLLLDLGQDNPHNNSRNLLNFYNNTTI
jgi:hypothetical protein